MADPLDYPASMPSPTGTGGRTDPDAHGQAALLLVESLIHGLIARSSLTRAEAIDIIDIAADVKIEYAEETEESRAILARSLVLIEALAETLRKDQG